MPSGLQDETQERCPDCGLELPRQSSIRHPYLGASPSCWALYNEVLAREYSSPALMSSVHRLTVDAYAAQHPGKPERRTIQSIWFHLVSLYLTLERGLAHGYARRVLGALSTQFDHLEWLTPPPSLGSITVSQVAAARDAASHEEIVPRWAREVWNAWQPYHPQIKSLAARHISPPAHR